MIMNQLKSFFILIYTLCAVLIRGCWHGILWLIDLIDGDEPNEEPELSSSYFNYRTGEIDPVQRADGIYDQSYR